MVHVNIVHLKKLPKKEPPKKSFFCEICGKSFNQSSNLKNHIETTHEVSKNQCDLCGKFYATERKLKLHKQDLHNKVIKCDNCDKLFGSRTRLNFHVSYSHDKSKPFGCTVCFKRFNFKKTLDQHVARVHETNSCSSCPYCGKYYSRLTCHIKICNSRWPDGPRLTFECPKNCGKTLSNKDSLRKHLKKFCSKI